MVSERLQSSLIIGGHLPFGACDFLEGKTDAEAALLSSCRDQGGEGLSPHPRVTSPLQGHGKSEDLLVGASLLLLSVSARIVWIFSSEEPEI